MPRYRRRTGSYWSRSDVGLQRALRHIQEGRELSALLGGTDNTVKKYLFNLSSTELGKILIEYGRLHGDSAREYAVQTLPRWRDGRVTMSGMVAERLYRLLPPTMPIGIKFDIAEELWRHVGPSSSRVIRFGREASNADLVRLGA
jgi:hypothetical protein